MSICYAELTEPPREEIWDMFFEDARAFLKFVEAHKLVVFTWGIDTFFHPGEIVKATVDDDENVQLKVKAAFGRQFSTNDVMNLRFITEECHANLVWQVKNHWMPRFEDECYIRMRDSETTYARERHAAWATDLALAEEYAAAGEKQMAPIADIETRT